MAEIRERILDGRLQPGTPIRLDAISEDLGVSTVPVREALKILEGEGQVKYRAHRGYSVTELDLEDLREIYRIRELLETEAARCALEHLTETDFERMRDAAKEMETYEGEDISVITTANRRFHFTLLDAAHMPHLQHLVRLLWDSSDPYRSLYYMEMQNRTRVNAEHREILDAAAAGDAERLIPLLDAHRRHAIEGLERILA